jgi:hypothetical protein
MGEIKSALEIALERTRDVEGDHENVKSHELKQKGQKSASKFIKGEISDLSKAFKEQTGKELRWFKEGVYETLISNLSLPTGEQSLEKMDTLEKGFTALTGEKKATSGLFGQLGQFFKQYLGDIEQLIEALDAQIAPRLKQKAEAMTQQTGMEVQIDPASDPEYAAALNQNKNQITERYREALNQAKGELRKLFDKSL